MVIFRTYHAVRPIQEFIETNQDKADILKQWQTAQNILEMTYPTEYTNVFQLYKAALRNAIGTLYLDKIKETPPPKDLTQLDFTYSSLQKLSDNLQI